MKFCVKCGSELANQARFCPKCGHDSDPAGAETKVSNTYLWAIVAMPFVWGLLDLSLGTIFPADQVLIWDTVLYLGTTVMLIRADRQQLKIMAPLSTV